MHRPLLAVTVAFVAVVAACAEEPAPVPSGLSAAGGAGFSIAQANGCFACHGDGGTGGAAGPALVGLAGSTVELTDGTTTVADTEYLRRSLSDPAAQKVAGYVIAMPAPALDAAEVDAIVTWLEEAGGEP